MRKRSKGLSKAISLLLALAMVVTCMPIPVYAYDNDLLADTESEERFTKEEGITGDEAAFKAEDDLDDTGEFGNDLSGDSDAVKYTFSIKYGQTEARSMLTMVNSFRTGSEAWAWKKGDEEKEYYTGLGTLQYDYDLEKTAMQRAAEIAISFSHTRPNGEDCYTAYSSNNGSRGENIAAGYSTASEVFVGWRENDEKYAGQGHRRNMLKGAFAYIGIGHAIVNGTHFWVQEFRSVPVDTTEKTAVDTSADVDIEIDPQLISNDTYKLESDKVTVGVGKTATLPVVTGSLTLPQSKPSALTLPFKNVSANWQTTAQDIVSVDGNTVTGLKAGSATLTTSLANIPITVTVTGDGGDDDSQYYFPYTITIDESTGFAIDWDRVPTLAQVKAAGGSASGGYVVNVNGVLHIAKMSQLFDYELCVPLTGPDNSEGYNITAEIEYDTSKEEPHCSIGFNGTKGYIAFRYFAMTWSEEQINATLSSMNIKLTKYKMATVLIDADTELVSAYSWSDYSGPYTDISVGTQEYLDSVTSTSGGGVFKFVLEAEGNNEIKSITATKNGKKVTINQTKMVDPGSESGKTYDVYSISGVEGGDALVVTVTLDGAEYPHYDPTGFFVNTKIWNTDMLDGPNSDGDVDDDCFKVEVSGCTKTVKNNTVEYKTDSDDIIVTVSTPVKPSNVADKDWDAPYHDVERYDFYATYCFDDDESTKKRIEIDNNKFTIPGKIVRQAEKAKRTISFEIEATGQTTTLLFDESTFNKASISYLYNYEFDLYGNVIPVSAKKIYIRKNADYQGIYVIPKDHTDEVSAVKLSEDKVNWTELTEVTDEKGNSYWSIPKSLTTSPKYLSIETKASTEVDSVTISPQIAEITLSGNPLTETAVFTAEVLPATAEDKSVTWTANPADAVRFSSPTDNPVTVTALKEGTVIITATANDGGKMDTATLTITKAMVADPVFTPTSGVYTVSQNIVISTETEGADIYYTTDGTEPSKTSTHYTGPVHVGEGTTVIKAIAFKDGMRDSNVVSGKYTIDKKAVPVTSVVVNPGAITILKGETFRFAAAVLPDNADDPTLFWSTSDQSKVTVDKYGMIKGISAGQATITATAAGNISASAKVTVSENTAIEKVLQQTDEDTKSDIVDDLDGGKLSDLISTNEKDKDAVVITDDTGNIKETRLWVGGIEKEYTYTGKQIKPEPHVYDGTTRLTEKKDYTLTYKKNTEAGTATIVVKFKGDYKSDPQEVTFKINPAVIGSDVIVIATAQEADKSATPKLTYIMKETGASVAAGKFTVNPAGKISIPEGQTRDVSVKAKDTNNFAGSTTVTVSAAAKTKLLSNAKVIFGAKSYIYTGKAIKPSYTLMMDKTIKLTEGTDYVVSAIYNNTEPGKATIVFEGKGDYLGSKTETFSINKGMDLSDKDVQKDNAIDVYINGQKNASVPYSKAGVTPAVTVYMNDVKLVEGTDYTVKFKDNKTITNDAKAEIKFKGKFKGSTTATFAIVKQSLSNLCIVTEDLFAKDGTLTEAKLVKYKLKITDNGKTLGKNDYDVEVTEKDASKGTAKLKISGKGCYTEDPVTVSYRVLKNECNINKAKVDKIEKSYTGNPVILTADDLKDKITLGSKLKLGTDFYIIEESYIGNIKKGTAKVTICGMGTMGGNKTISFKIVQKSAKWNGSYADGKFNN